MSQPSGSAYQNPYSIRGRVQLLERRYPAPLGHFDLLRTSYRKGQAVSGQHQTGLLDYIVGGWVINTVSVYQTGFPLQIYQTNLNSAYGYGVQRPNMTGTSPGTSGSVEQRLYNYINPAAFSTAPAGTFGNTPRTLGSLRGPGADRTGISPSSRTSLRERVKAQFRAEALNAFNSPYFYSPNTNLSSGTFGQINSQANFARQLQIGDSRIVLSATVVGGVRTVPQSPP